MFPRLRMTADQQNAFLVLRTPARTRLLQSSVIGVCGFYLCCILFDILLLGDVTLLAISLRFGVVLPAALVLMTYVSGDHPIAHKEHAALGVAILGNVCWCIILLASRNPAVLGYFYAAASFQMVVTIAAASPFRPSLIASLLIFVLNYTVIWFLEDSSPAYVLQHMAVYLPTVGMTLLVTYQLESEAIANFLQMQENEVLKRELSRQNKDLARLSVTDPLTRLSNRRGTESELSRLRLEMPQAMENAVVLIIDVDHFKAFNDGYGHGAGDDCLKRVARAMRRALPLDAHLARQGGEEFLAILPATNAENAAIIAEALRRSVRQLGIAHEFTRDRNRHVTVSVGAATGTILNDDDFQSLLDCADQAVYAAKADGRNGWRVNERRPVAQDVA
ncbi:GGDEF domain-containing protein [Rhizobium sp. SL42]|uniref:GGDEF domain-containing protein n=1 Tax=Rhizobium sp. SL42 TaxID=2806346 RepID=UPI001F3B12B6|nr:GGDEF domain-containing protein [Rhizobium sp. SL42]UJW76530.1 GGDEF domain-containing protein [Rhizobium sp. SL42]